MYHLELNVNINPGGLYRLTDKSAFNKLVRLFQENCRWTYDFTEKWIRTRWSALLTTGCEFPFNAQVPFLEEVDFNP